MERLLIVDDDEFMRMTTLETLSKVGYHLEWSTDGETAWGILNERPNDFDLVLLDKQMPYMDGIALLKRIKSDARIKDLPVVMLTGASDQQDIAEGLAAGAHYYLTKPASEKLLTSVINNAIHDLRRKRELLSLVGHQTGAMRILRRAEFRFRTLKEAESLSLWLADASTVPQRTVNAYAELLINSVEHGNLEIDYADKSRLLKEERWIEEVESRLQRQPYAERYVDVTLERDANSVKVTIKDQGHGFDWINYLDFSPERAFDLHGRGIAMANLMGFDSLQYQGNGNTVTATILLD